MDVEDFKAILVEAKIMAYITDNPNVVLFLGADVTGIMDSMCSGYYLQMTHWAINTVYNYFYFLWQGR